MLPKLKSWERPTWRANRAGRATCCSPSTGSPRSRPGARFEAESGPPDAEEMEEARIWADQLDSRSPIAVEAAGAA